MKALFGAMWIGICAAAPTLAERVECSFQAPCMAAACVAEAIPVAFTIDHNQFVDPVHRGEPPRNKVTQVALGEHVFPAEPILMSDGTRGFWAEVAGVEHLMTTRPDGMGTYATTGAIPFMTGRCTIEAAS